MTLENSTGTREIDVTESFSKNTTTNRKVMYPKSVTQSAFIGKFDSNSGTNTPQSSSLGAIPVSFQPSSNYNSPSQQYTTVSAAYSSPAQYVIEGPGNYQYIYGNQGIPYIAVPIATLSPPTLIGTYSGSAASPQIGASYASHGLVPAQGIVYTSLGTSSPLNASRPTKNYPGCC